MSDLDPIKSSDTSLGDLLSSHDDLSPELKSELENLIQMESHVEAMEADRGEASEAFDIRSSRDRMKVLLVLKPLEESESGPDLDSILDKINDMEISCPIDMEKLEDAIKNLPLESPIEVSIGEGRAAQHGKNGYIEFHVDDPTESALDTDEESRVDYRWHRKIVDVKKDQELITIHPPSEPVNGSDVYGNVLEGRKGKVVSMVAGENTNNVNDTLYAACDGCVKKVGNKLSVEELLTLPRGVNMETGNIETKCRVSIKGTVEEGFVVKSTQDIIIDGNVEGATVESSEGRVVVNGGVFGKSKGLVRAKKSLWCRFAQQAMLSCEGGIEVEDSLVHCTIICGETLRVMGGKHGVIMGGTIRISHSIEAMRIGAPGEPRTDLIMGFDFKYEKEMRELDRYRLKIKTLMESLVQSLDEKEKSGKKLLSGTQEEVEHQKQELALKKKVLLCKVENEKTLAKIKSIEKKAYLSELCHVRIVNDAWPNTMVHMLLKQSKIEQHYKGLNIEVDPSMEEIRLLEVDH